MTTTTIPTPGPVTHFAIHTIGGGLLATAGALRVGLAKTLSLAVTDAEGKKELARQEKDGWDSIEKGRKSFVDAFSPSAPAAKR